MVGTAKRALPTLQIPFVIASEAKQSRSKKNWIASSLRSSQ
jgi:hypothetical protein